MPEYLAPGVYIEETSYRAKSIEGVATSTTGFVGPASTGPITGPARLVTSFEEFNRLYGGLDDLVFGDKTVTNYLAFSARAYFENGGRRLYVARLFNTNGADDGLAKSGALSFGGKTAQFVARFPGKAANALKVSVSGTRSGNVLLAAPVNGSSYSPGLRSGDLVEVSAVGGLRRARFTAKDQAPVTANVYAVAVDSAGVPSLRNADGTHFTPTSGAVAQKLGLTIAVSGTGRGDSYANLSTHPSSDGFVGTVLRETDPPDAHARVRLALPDNYASSDAVLLLGSLLTGSPIEFTGGDDGELPTSTTYEGLNSENNATSGKDALGLYALEEIEDIAIVAAPGSGALDDAQAIRDKLLGHCERLKYRFAVLSAGPEDNTTEDIRNVRAVHDSSYGALYYPWIVVPDPAGDASARLTLPPEGFMAGIYARSDIERGVHKAPANEIVRGALQFSVPISHGTQEVLNPEGINCMRFFEGRGNRIWGARTLSSDPEWKYLNVRRLFIYLEHSIDRATQWAVFEPNNEQLWKKVTLTIESFLVDTWRTGALMGTSPKEAFFVRCDRTTMTQGDLDNGRLVCLIGVAPTKPAEFVIFRIGQWTADASLV